MTGYRLRERESETLRKQFVKEEEKMLRTRLLWFTLGFSVAGASIGHLVWRDLYGERFAISSDIKEQFNALEGRVSGLESAGCDKSTPVQVES